MLSVIVAGKYMSLWVRIRIITASFNFSFYFIQTHGRIRDHQRRSSVYINTPPSYIFQSLLFQSRWCVTAEGVDEGSPLTLILTFSSTFFFSFHFSSGLLLFGIRVDGLSVLTRVGSDIQTLASVHFPPSCSCPALLEYQQEWRRLLCALAGDAGAAAASERTAFSADVWDTPASHRLMGTYLFYRRYSLTLS